MEIEYFIVFVAMYVFDRNFVDVRNTHIADITKLRRHYEIYDVIHRHFKLAKDVLNGDKHTDGHLSFDDGQCCDINQ